MNLLSRLMGTGELLLYHDYRAGHFQDLSGQGKHGTPTSVSLIKRALCFANTTGQYVNAGADNIGTGAGSLWAFCRPFSYGEGGGGRIFDNNALKIYQIATERIRITFSSIAVTATNDFPLHQNNFLVATWDASGFADMWINGVQVLSGENIGAPFAGSNMLIGNRSTIDRQFHGQMYAIGAVDRELTPAEIAELETEVRTGTPDTREVIREIDSSYDLRASHLGPGARVTTANITAGQIPGTPFWVSSGAFSADVDTVNGKPAKVLTCQTAGVAYAKWGEFRNNQSEAAYGTWRYLLCKAAGSSSRIMPVASVPGPFNVSASQNGYMIDTAANENIVWRRVSTGALTQLFNTAQGTATESVYEEYKVTRSPAGEWSVYLNGTLVPVSTGTNPVTDNTHVTGKYVNLDLDAGDKIALAHLDGTPLFSKYLGVV